MSGQSLAAARIFASRARLAARASAARRTATLREASGKDEKMSRKKSALSMLEKTCRLGSPNIEGADFFRDGEHSSAENVILVYFRLSWTLQNFGSPEPQPHGVAVLGTQFFFWSRREFSSFRDIAEFWVPRTTTPWGCGSGDPIFFLVPTRIFVFPGHCRILGPQSHNPVGLRFWDPIFFFSEADLCDERRKPLGRRTD